LLQLEKIIKSLQNAKEDIKNDFSKDGNLFRVKRMSNYLNDNDIIFNNSVQPTLNSKQKRSGIVKSLNFASPTTCTSTGGKNPGLYLPRSQSHHRCQVGYKAFGSLTLTRGQTQVHQFPPPAIHTNPPCLYRNTSSPIQMKNIRNADTTLSIPISPIKGTKVTVSVEYPGKTCKRTLPSEYETIGKSLVRARKAKKHSQRCNEI
jgi:hypothetical protein